MSFISVLKTIGNVFTKTTAIVTPLEPAIAAVPGFGVAFDTIFNAVVQTEQMFAGVIASAAPAAATAINTAKKTVATQLVTAALPAVAAPPPPETVSSAIDEVVAILNQLQKLQVATSPPAPSAAT